MADLLERVLRNLGFAPLLPLFQRDKIDSITIASSLTDVELNRLGISTIGDRIRLREALKNAVKGELQNWNKFKIRVWCGFVAYKTGLWPDSGLYTICLTVYTLSSRNCIFQNLTFLKDLKKNIRGLYRVFWDTGYWPIF